MATMNDQAERAGDHQFQKGEAALRVGDAHLHGFHRIVVAGDQSVHGVGVGGALLAGFSVGTVTLTAMRLVLTAPLAETSERK